MNRVWGLVLTVGVLAGLTAAFAAARSNRNKALLAALPSVPLTDFQRTAAALIIEKTENVKKDPLSPACWGELGYALAGNDAGREAAVCFARAEQLEPDNVRWPHLFAICTMKSTRRPEAIAALKRALKLQPNTVATLGLLGETYLEDGNDAELDALLRPQVDEKTDDARLLWLMATVETHAGAIDRALAFAERAAASPPQRQQIHRLLAQLYKQKGNAARTAREERLLELLSTPSQETTWPDAMAAQINYYSRRVNQVAAQARSLVASGSPGAALRMLDQLVPEDRAQPVAKAARALIMARMNDFKQAEALMAAVPDQGEPNVMFARAMIAMMQGKDAEAAAEFQKMTKAPLTEQGLRAIDSVHFNHGMCLERLGRADEAVAAFEEALKVNRGNLGALIHLAELYLRKNRKADAAPLLADAALLNPTDDAIRELQKVAAR